MTPETAQALEPGTTDGPWEVKTGHGDDADVWIESSGAEYPDGEPRQICETTFVDNWADLELMAAAPDMRATIAAQTWEYRIEEWSGEYWYPCETWTDDFSLYDGYAKRENERLVRRPVGPVEVVEG